MNDEPLKVRTPLRVRRVHPLRALLWLKRGWEDFMHAPLIGLLHGLVAAGFGVFMLWLAWEHASWFWPGLAVAVLVALVLIVVLFRFLRGLWLRLRGGETWPRAAPG